MTPIERLQKLEAEILSLSTARNQLIRDRECLEKHIGDLAEQIQKLENEKHKLMEMDGRRG